MQISFVVAVNNREILENNFLASPCLGALPQSSDHGPKEHFSSSAKAYNSAMDQVSMIL